MDMGKIKDLGSGPLIEVLHKVDQLFPTEKPQEILETFQELHDRHQKVAILCNGKNKLSNTVVYLESIGDTALVSFKIGIRLSSCGTIFFLTRRVAKSGCQADDKDPDSSILLLIPHVHLVFLRRSIIKTGTLLRITLGLLGKP